MGKGWVVPSAAALAMSLVLVANAERSASMLSLVPIALALCAAFWAYAIADAGYGARAPVVATALYAAVAGALAIGLLFDTGDLAARGWAALTALLCVASLATALAEAKRRRGAVRWGAVVALCAPLVVAAVAVAVG